MLGTDFIAQGQNARDQGHQTLLIRVPAAVPLHRDVFRNWQVPSKLRFGRGDLARRHQRLKHVSGRWRHELRCNFGAGDFREEMMPSHDLARRIYRQSRSGTSHDRRGQCHERGGGNAQDATPNEQIGHSVFELRLIRRVNQVHPPRRSVSQGRGECGNPCFHTLIAEATCTEEAHHAGRRHGNDHVGCGDAVRHLAGDVGETHAVRCVELRISKPLRVGRGECGEYGEVGRARLADR